MDINRTFDALGRMTTPAELDEMVSDWIKCFFKKKLKSFFLFNLKVSEAPGPINFTMFLTIFGDRVQGTDDEQTVVNAFSQFDEGEGKCKEEKYVLMF